MRFVLGILKLIAKSTRFRAAVSILRLLSIPTYVETLWAFFHGETAVAAVSAWLILGWIVSTTCHVLHLVLLSKDLSEAFWTHLEELKEPEKRTLLVRTYIFLGVLLGHIVAIVFAIFGG